MVPAAWYSPDQLMAQSPLKTNVPSALLKAAKKRKEKDEVGCDEFGMSYRKSIVALYGMEKLFILLRSLYVGVVGTYFFVLTKTKKKKTANEIEFCLYWTHT